MTDAILESDLASPLPRNFPASIASRSEDAGDDLTELLRSWKDAGRQRERLFDRIYPELHRLARQQLARERSSISIQATELVHEAYLRLVDQRRSDWQCRAQFYALAALTLRRILVDHAKHRRRHKRGAGAVHLSLDETLIPGTAPELDVLALDQALVELAKIRLTTARVVELRYFAGLSLEETAAVMGIARKTVQRRWRFARAWLGRRLGA